MLNPLCLALSPVALAIVFGYSYTKRFTALSHLRARPGPGDRARSARGWRCAARFDATPIVLGLAVLAWVAGFDTIYACQDADFDRARGPALAAGAPRRRAGALRSRASSTVAAVASARALYGLEPLHPLYLAGVAGVAALLVYEHSLVQPDDLSRVDAAFFTVNGWISVGYLAVTYAARRLA